MSLKAIKSFLGLKKTKKLYDVPNAEKPIEISLGERKFKLKPHDELWGQEGEDPLTAMNTKKLKKRLKQLEDENRMLKYKQEVLLDMLSLSNLDVSTFSATLEKLKSHHRK